MDPSNTDIAASAAKIAADAVELAPDASMHHSTAVEILGVMVPIVAIVMGIGVVLLGIWLDYRKKRDMFEMVHKERMAAIDKGIDVPPLPPELFQNQRFGRTPADYLRRGLVWFFTGVALTFALFRVTGGESGPAYFGLIPTGIGLANLIMFLYASRQPAPPANGASG
jgi:hypothetical protein